MYNGRTISGTSYENMLKAANQHEVRAIMRCMPQINRSCWQLKIISLSLLFSLIIVFLCASHSSAVERWLIIVWDDSAEGMARFEAFCMDRGMTSADVLEINGYSGGQLPLRGRELLVPGSREAFFFTWLEIQNRTGGEGPVFAITPRGIPAEAPEPDSGLEVYTAGEPEIAAPDIVAPDVIEPEVENYLPEHEHGIPSLGLTGADIEAMFEQRREEHIPLVTIMPHGMADDEPDLPETPETLEPDELPETYTVTEPDIIELEITESEIAEPDITEPEIETLPEPENVELEIEPEVEIYVPGHEYETPSQGLTGADIEAMFEQMREEHVPLVTIRPHGMPDDEPDLPGLPEIPEAMESAYAETPEPYELPETSSVTEPDAAEPEAIEPEIIELEIAVSETAEAETAEPEDADLGIEVWREPENYVEYDPYDGDDDFEYGLASLTAADIEAMFEQMREEHVPLVTIMPHDVDYVMARAQAAAARPPVPELPTPEPPIPQVREPPVTPPTVEEVRGRMIWPVSGRVSSGFGRRGRRNHQGIDIPMPAGTPILAALDGVVIASVPVGHRGFRGYGNTVVIDHGNGIVTLYAHNSQNKVTRGQWVRQGEVIALVGRTGRATTNHLHFEVRINGRPVDPVPFLVPR